MLSIIKMDEYFPEHSSVKVDEAPVIVEYGTPLETHGVQWCTVVCVAGIIKEKMHIGMAHVMSDESEVDVLVEAFKEIYSISLIGGTDEWFSQPIFDNLSAKMKTYKKADLDIRFNPTDSDPEKKVDVYIDSQGRCIVTISNSMSYQLKM